MTKRVMAAICLWIQLAWIVCVSFAASAEALPKYETKQYRVSYYTYDCFNMQDENGQKYGYGYDMMQNIAKYMQCTFAYIGYGQTAKESEEQLRKGEIDI